MKATGKLKADAFDNDPLKVVLPQEHCRLFCCLLELTPPFNFSHTYLVYTCKLSLEGSIRNQRPFMMVGILTINGPYENLHHILS